MLAFVYTGHPLCLQRLLGIATPTAPNWLIYIRFAHAVANSPRSTFRRPAAHTAKAKTARSENFLGPALPNQSQPTDILHLQAHPTQGPLLQFPHLQITPLTKTRSHNTKPAKPRPSRKENVGTTANSPGTVVRRSPSSTRRPRQRKRLFCEWSAQLARPRCS